jgi:hypothetical protein
MTTSAEERPAAPAAVRVRRRAMGILFILSGALFLAGVLDPPILPTWGGSAADVMTAGSAHRTAWFASTWLITLAIVAGLAAVEILARVAAAPAAHMDNRRAASRESTPGRVQSSRAT